MTKTLKLALVSERGARLLEPSWSDPMGPSYADPSVVASDEVAQHFVIPDVPAAVFTSEPLAWGWLLLEGWWRGLLDTDRLVDLLGGEVDGPFADLLVDPDLAARIWPGLSEWERTCVVQWGSEILRGHGADALLCAGRLIFLGEPPWAAERGASVAVTSHPMFSEVPLPEPVEVALPVKVKPTARVPRVPTEIGNLLGSQGTLVDALGLLADSCSYEGAWEVDSLLELRRQLLLDGLEAGELSFEVLSEAFAAVGHDLAEDEVRESLVDLADQLELPGEVAVAATAGARARLRRTGVAVVTFRSSSDVLILPHYFLRGLSDSPLWKAICAGEKWHA